MKSPFSSSDICFHNRSHSRSARAVRRSSPANAFNLSASSRKCFARRSAFNFSKSVARNAAAIFSAVIFAFAATRIPTNASAHTITRTIAAVMNGL